MRKILFRALMGGMAGGFGLVVNGTATAAVQFQVEQLHVEKQAAPARLAAAPTAPAQGRYLHLLAQGTSTPDTSMAGSRSPVTSRMARMRPSARQQEQVYAAELRRCEAMDDAIRKQSCTDSVRREFGEM